MNTPDEAFQALKDKGIVKELLRQWDDILSDAIVDNLDYVDDDEERSDERNEERYIHTWLLVMREFRRENMPFETWGPIVPTGFDTFGVDMNEVEG